MTQPVTELHQAGYTARLCRKIGIWGDSFSVIIQVKYIFTHCSLLPAFQTWEGLAGRKAWVNTSRLPSSLWIMYATGAVMEQEAGQPSVKWTLQNMYMDVCQLYYNFIKKQKIQSVFYRLEWNNVALQFALDLLLWESPTFKFTRLMCGLISNINTSDFIRSF